MTGNEPTKKPRGCYWTKYKSLREGKLTNYDSYDARSNAFNCGLAISKPPDEVTVADRKRYTVEVQENHHTLLWDDQISFEEWSKIWHYQYHPIRGFACLDGNISDPRGRWIAPGKMGWFGISDVEEATQLNYNLWMKHWGSAGNQSDWLILVDCHV